MPIGILRTQEHFVANDQFAKVAKPFEGKKDKIQKSHVSAKSTPVESGRLLTLQNKQTWNRAAGPIRWLLCSGSLVPWCME